MIRLLLFLLCLALALPARADEFRPAYLQLTQIDAETYDVMWKAPAIDEFTTLKVNPVFPSGAAETSPKQTSFADGISVQRWRIRLAGGFEGRTISFSDLGTTRIDVLVRVARSDGTEQLERISPVAPTFVVLASPGPFEVVQSYTVLGVEHILNGFDHLLFVLALLILVGGVKRVLQTVTAFTLAHSITLALATLGVLNLPGALVEALIALSIMFVAIEILQQRRGREGMASRRPWVVAFSFGLLHGLGFAGALSEIGLPQNAIPLALLFFNVGVEIGQVMFILAVLLVVRLTLWLVNNRVDLKPAPLFAAYMIGGLSTFWMFERVVGFWV